MRDPRNDCWWHLWSYIGILALNFISYSSVVEITTHSSSLFGIRIGFSSSSSLVFSLPNLFDLFLLPFLPYLYHSLNGVVMMKKNSTYQWVPPYHTTKQMGHTSCYWHDLLVLMPDVGYCSAGEFPQGITSCSRHILRCQIICSTSFA